MNDIGAEVGNPSMCDGRDLPWLQDTVAVNAHSLWNPNYRDVVILDANNVPVAVYNLTDHSLLDPANVEELSNLLRSVAGE